jgi:hypothetical protein
MLARLPTIGRNLRAREGARTERSHADGIEEKKNHFFHNQWQWVISSKLPIPIASGSKEELLCVLH